MVECSYNVSVLRVIDIARAGCVSWPVLCSAIPQENTRSCGDVLVIVARRVCCSAGFQMFSRVSKTGRVQASVGEGLRERPWVSWLASTNLLSPPQVSLPEPLASTCCETHFNRAADGDRGRLFRWLFHATGLSSFNRAPGPTSH